MSLLGGGLLGSSGGGGGGGGGGISNVVEDTTPQLGGDLDTNGNDITLGTDIITGGNVMQYHSVTTNALVAGQIAGINNPSADSISIVHGGVATDIASGAQAQVVGAYSYAKGISSVAYGYYVQVQGTYSSGLGSTSKVTTDYGTAVGGGATVTGIHGTAIGGRSSTYGARVTCRGGIAVGSSEDGAGGNATVGAYAHTGARAQAYGCASECSGADAVQFGVGTNSTANTFQISGMDLNVQGTGTSNFAGSLDVGGDLDIEGNLNTAGIVNNQGVGVTISGGTFTITASFHIVDTEGGAGSDNLTNVVGGTEGDFLTIRTADSGRDVTFEHLAGGAGQFDLISNSNTTLPNISSFMYFQYLNNRWQQLAGQQ